MSKNTSEVWNEGYEGNIILVVQEVCDSDGTVADPRAEQHEKSHSGLYFAALQKEETNVHKYQWAAEEPPYCVLETFLRKEMWQKLKAFK